MLHSEIASERNKFNIKDVINNLSKKLKRRHPHVFKKRVKLNNIELEEQWKEIKIKEGKKIDKDNPFSLLNNSETAQPAIIASNIIDINKNLLIIFFESIIPFFLVLN